ncbi:GGDEF domain-containing protein [Luteimonas sp. Y-2-2-4F]|nr:GGDEF domain-containing protein [Luteimonas sp. Y-2-2-4F]MCD9030342.1 GGDEF domain-containing protein [Luteimonas sp. Y-2-2-4F]
MKPLRHPALAAALLAALALAPPAAPAAPSPPSGTAAIEALIDDEIGRCLDLRESDPSGAIAVAETVLARPGLPPEQEVIAQTCLGAAAAHAGPPERAAAAAARVERLLLEGEYSPEFRLRALSQAGGILHQVGQLHGALDLYIRAYQAAQAGDLPAAQVMVLNNIGSIHSSELEAPEIALTYYQQAEAIERSLEHPGPVLAYNQAENLIRLGRRAEALPYLERAAGRAREHDHEVALLRVQALLAALGPEPSAPADRLARLRELAQAQEALPDAGGHARTLSLMAGIRLDAGEAAAALGLAQDAERRAAGHPGARDEQQRALRLQIDAQRALGDYRAALDTAERMIGVERDALRMQNIRGLAELQARMEDAQQAQALEALRLQEEAQARVLAQTRLLRNVAIASLALLVLASAGLALYQRRVQRRLRTLGATDALTGLLNRGAAADRLRAMPPRSGDLEDRRNVLFLIDVDDFKRRNDLHGHAAGDALLVELAARLREICRPGDIVARWGGEEFLVACPGLDLDQASAVAERLRQGVSQPPFRIGAPEPVRLSISLGFACWPFFGLTRRQDREVWQEAVMLADRALYASKHGGRDAWTGLWGVAGRACTIAKVLEDPAGQAAGGCVAIATSRPPAIWTPQT